MTTSLDQLKIEIVQFAARMAELQLVPNTQGNISGRDLETGLIAVTPHDFSYKEMTPDDIVVVDLQGRKVDGRHKSSDETPVHCVVYRERPHINGIVHAEPIYTNCFGVLNKPIMPVVVSLPIAVGGDEVPIMPFTHSGSEEFGYKMLEVMGNRNAVVWANHGMLSMGKTLELAFRCTVAVETAARIYYLALQLGEPSFVTLEDIYGAVA